MCDLLLVFFFPVVIYTRTLVLFLWVPPVLNIGQKTQLLKRTRLG